MEGTLPMTEETLKSFTGSEMEMGLLQTLMGPQEEQREAVNDDDLILQWLGARFEKVQNQSY